jgi:hypothetical protein
VAGFFATARFVKQLPALVFAPKLRSETF